MSTEIWVPALLIGVGLIGIIVPILPGLLLVLGAVLLWAWQVSTPLAWWLFALCALFYAAGVSLQYLVPGRRMRRAGVRTSTLVLAVVLGIVGFFVIPVVGGPVGFVLGIYLVEHGRSRDAAAAWQSTKTALRAVFLSIGIELIAGLAIATTWVAGVMLSR
ncbi:MAG TPA: DUF456 domain-containing protein [Pedococcus sp.]|nr:DUF456 domain-containing protein [Pedococcus sp.]